MAERTFKLSEVAKAVNEGVSTLQSWIDKKWIQFPNPGQGKARELSVLDAYTIALAAGIRQTGVAASTAGEIARVLICSSGAFQRAKERMLAEVGTTEEEVYRKNPTAYIQPELTSEDLDEAIKNRNCGNPHIALVEMGRSPWGIMAEKSMQWRISILDTSEHRLNESRGFGIFFNVTDILVFTDNMLGIPYTV